MTSKTTLQFRTFDEKITIVEHRIASQNIRTFFFSLFFDVDADCPRIMFFFFNYFFMSYCCQCNCRTMKNCFDGDFEVNFSIRP